MRKKLLKLVSMMSVMMYALAGKVFALDGIQISDSGTKEAEIIKQIRTFVGPISAILIFFAVLMVGFEIIMKRNKADERMASMTSLMWIGIGALILGSAGTIFSFVIQ